MRVKQEKAISSKVPLAFKIPHPCRLLKILNIMTKLEREKKSLYIFKITAFKVFCTFFITFILKVYQITYCILS